MSPSYVVQIENLCSTFSTRGVRSVIHQNLNLSIARGEFLSIVGGSGSGKTVLLRQMLGLETPQSGSVTVLGEPASELGRAGAASRVGMLFQQGALFSAFTVLENIAFPLRELGTLPRSLIHDTAMVKMQMVGLDPAVAHQKRAAERLNASWHEIDTGHYPMLSTPDELARLIISG